MRQPAYLFGVFFSLATVAAGFYCFDCIVSVMDQITEQFRTMPTLSVLLMNNPS